MTDPVRYVVTRLAGDLRIYLLRVTSPVLPGGTRSTEWSAHTGTFFEAEQYGLAEQLAFELDGELTATHFVEETRHACGVEPPLWTALPNE